MFAGREFRKSAMATGSFFRTIWRETKKSRNAERKPPHREYGGCQEMEMGDEAGPRDSQGGAKAKRRNRGSKDFGFDAEGYAV